MLEDLIAQFGRKRAYPFQNIMDVRLRDTDQPSQPPFGQFTIPHPSPQHCR